MLVERADVLRALAERTDTAHGGRGSAVFLGGEAGVGKTSVVRALTDDAGGLAVRIGGCDSVVAGEPLGPFLDALPEMAALPELSDATASADRVRLFRRVRRLLAAEPTLLVVEDAHWADEASLDLLRFVGRRLADIPLLLVATFRADEVDAAHPLTAVIGDLVTLPNVEQIQLGPLSIRGVAHLLDEAESGLSAAAVHESTGGNPFFVTEIIAAGTPDVPPTVRGAVLARAARLSDPAREVLAAAAVLGPRAPLQRLSIVSGRTVADVSECVERGMLVADGDGFSFRHELARRAVEESLTPSVRVGLHAAAYRALGGSGADERRLALHAAGAEDAAAVCRYAPRAAERAARLGAHREAAELYRLALRFDDAQDPRARAELLSRLSYECYLIDRLDDALAARQEALELWERVADPFAVGVAARWLSRLSWFLGNNAAAETSAEHAVRTLEPLGPSAELAMAYSNVSQLRMLSSDFAAAAEWGLRALTLARAVGDIEVEIHALNNLGAAQMSVGDALEGSKRLKQSLDLALANDAHEHAARAYTNLGTNPAIQHDVRTAEPQLQAGVAYCAERDLDSWRLYMSGWLARCRLEQGDHAEAAVIAADVLRSPRLAPISRMVAGAVTVDLEVRRAGTEPTQLTELLDLAARTGEPLRLVPLTAARATRCWIAGDRAGVTAAVDLAWPSLARHPDPLGAGLLGWWLAVAGDRRELPVAAAEPFGAMLAGAWTDAAAAWLELGCTFWAALALARSPDIDDARQAVALLDAADAGAVRDAVLRDRHTAGLPVPRGPVAARQNNPAGLTAREMEVLTMLVEGRSNADIAKRLFLSEKTVGHHVSAVLRKLGEPTRALAAATAVRTGLVAPG